LFGNQIIQSLSPALRARHTIVTKGLGEPVAEVMERIELMDLPLSILCTDTSKGNKGAICLEMVKKNRKLELRDSGKGRFI